MTSVKPEITLVSEDARGEIYAIEIGDRELILLHSKAGTLRGGHSHDVPESNMVLTGKLRYTKMFEDGVVITQLLQDGDVSRNEANQVHRGYFEEDSWMLEWKICKDKSSWKNTNYKPWRDEVDAHAR